MKINTSDEEEANKSRNKNIYQSESENECQSKFL